MSKHYVIDYLIYKSWISKKIKTPLLDIQWRKTEKQKCFTSEFSHKYVNGNNYYREVNIDNFEKKIPKMLLPMYKGSSSW